jgi:hypothetical protein
VLLARGAVGVNVATKPLYVTVPATATPPVVFFSVKVVALIEAEVIASLNVAVNTWPTGTFTAPFAGTVATTVGTGVIVEKLHT